MASSIRALFENTDQTDTPKIKTIKNSDHKRKVVGLHSVQSKIRASIVMLRSAQDSVDNAISSIENSADYTETQESADTYTDLEAAWAAIEESTNLLSLGKTICERIAGDVGVPPVANFAKRVVDEDEK